MTGEPVPFSASQLDHAVSLGLGGKDEPENWHWMEARYNQVKGAREDDEVLKMIEEVIKLYMIQVKTNEEINLKLICLSLQQK